MNATSPLVRILEKNPDLQILVASDAEGNSFSSLDDVSIQYVDRHYAGGRTEEIWDAEDLLDDVEDSDEEAEVLSNFKKVLVIWPV